MQLHSTIALEIKLQYDNLGNKIELVSRTDSIVKHDEADISLISSKLHAVSRGAQTVRILSDDTDMFIIFVCWCHKANVTCPIQMEKWDGTVLNHSDLRDAVVDDLSDIYVWRMVLNINDTVSRLGSTCSGILGMHALSGCDTVSYLNGKGKVSALKVLSQNNITGLDGDECK